MAAGLDDAAADLALDLLSGSGTAPTGPLMLRLTTTAPTASTPGTEVTGGSYAPADASIGAAGGRTQTNTAEVRIPGMPAVTVAGLELWDSAATTPVRVWWDALATAKTVNAGDDFVIEAGKIDLSM